MVSNNTKPSLINICLFAGIAIPCVFFSLSLILASFLDNYNHLAMTVSEIGRKGSPMQFAWGLTNILVALLFCIFASGVYAFAVKHRLSRIPAYFIFYYGLTTTGYTIFEAPHPLHNVVGLLQLIGYMAPLAMAIAWRKQPLVSKITRWSFICWGCVLIAILFNMAPMFEPKVYTSGYYGLIQRSVFFVFHGAWCVYVAWGLYKTDLSMRAEKPV
jgi:hypothetical membrane protein